MAHNLDINEGQASFVSARVDAWHQLGTVLPDAFDADAALHYGGLKNWNLRKGELQAVDSEGNTVTFPNRYAILRDNPVTKGQVDALGVVGGRYDILQNEELVGLLDALVDEAGASFETAGAIAGGRHVFVTMKIPTHIKIGGVDKVDSYIAATTSHDGSASTRLLITPVRIVCQNTLNVALSGANNQFQFRHTTGARQGLVSEARQALDLTFNYLDGFQEQADRLINTEMSSRVFEKIISNEFGAPEGAPKPTVTRSENKIQEMVYLFEEASTQKEIRGTAWAGFNALTEWYDHFSPVRGRGESASTQRATKAITNTRFKNRALELMS